MFCCCFWVANSHVDRLNVAIFVCSLKKSAKLIDVGNIVSAFAFKTVQVVKLPALFCYFEAFSYNQYIEKPLKGSFKTYATSNCNE